MLIARVLRLSCYRKTLQNLTHLNCGLQIRQIWIRLITFCGDYCKRTYTKCTQLIQTNETATENGVGQAGSCRHCGNHSSVASSIASDQWYVFCTLSLQYFPRVQLDSNLANLGPQLRCDKFRSFFYNNWTVAHARWAFQVSQGNVETLFRWGGKYLHYFARIFF